MFNIFKDLNLLDALSNMFKNIANPNGNLQGAMQGFAGQLIGFLVNMFGGIFAQLFGGSKQQVAELAKTATDAFGRHMQQANEAAAQAAQQAEAARLQRQQQAPGSVIGSSSPSFTPARDAELSAISSATDSSSNDLTPSVGLRHSV